MMSSKTPSDAIQTQHKPKRRLSCLAIGVATLICLVGVAVVGLFVWRNVAIKRLDTAIAALKANGHPTNGDELMATYQMPDGVNPGPLWITAAEMLEDSGPDVVKLPFIGAEGDEPKPPGQAWDQLEPTRAYLEKHAEAIAMLERASRIRNLARYDNKLVWDGPEDAVGLSYIPTHRHICRVMGMACYVNAHDGNPAGVAKSIETGLRVSHSLSDEPSSMGQLIGTACGAMSLANIEEFISLEYEDEQLASLQETIREFSPQQSLLRGLEGETVLVLSNFKNPKMTGPLRRNEDAAFLVEQLVPLMEVVKKSGWSEILREAVRMENVAAKIQSGGGANATRYGLSTQFMPSVVALVNAKARGAANLSLYDALIAARRFELASDRLPQSFEELVPGFLPAIPIDPFSKSGESLILKTEDSVTKIYSRGINAIDDGGDPTQNDSITPIDMVLELKRIRN